MNERKGQCMCGAVSFVARRVGNFGVCHCRTCQRWTGSALFAVTVAEADMSIQGAENIGTIRSSSWASRSWCGRCGSALWYRYDKGVDDTGEYEVPVGLLDDANGLVLAREIFIDLKPDSYALAGEHERLTEAETFASFGSQVDGA